MPKFGVLYVSTLKFETGLGYIMDCPWQGAKVWSALCSTLKFETDLGYIMDCPWQGAKVWSALWMHFEI